MRIAYTALYLDKNIMEGGVGEKIGTQIKFWRDFGHEVKLFALSPDALNLMGASIFQYTYWKFLPFIKPITRFFARSVAMSKLIREVRRYHPDLIYLRNGLFIYPLHWIYKIAPMAVELNSYDIREYRYQGWFVYWINLITRGFTLKSAAGLISTSYEIAEISDNAKYGKPVIVIGNSIDLSRNRVLKAPSNKIPVITLVGSPGMIWHGVDKLIWLAEYCPDLIFNIVGYRQEDVDDYIPPNVHLHGFLSREKVKDILKTTDVACGTLALHRKSMEEASPLKVREAAAYGIPLILAYRDTALSLLQTDCILQLPNTEDNVKMHAVQIRTFAYKMIGKRLDENILKTYIGHQYKETARLNFFEELIKNYEGRQN